MDAIPLDCRRNVSIAILSTGKSRGDYYYYDDDYCCCCHVIIILITMGPTTHSFK